MSVFIKGVAHYLPKNIIPNSYFLDVNGLTEDWIYSRTGMRNRRRAGDEDTVNTMSLEVVKDLLNKYSVKEREIDLIIGVSYTPNDLVYTNAHYVQRHCGLTNAKVIFVSSACSAFISAMEVVEGFFASGKARNAIVVVAENNSRYSRDSCEKSGHLWGDGAAAILLDKSMDSKSLGEVAAIDTVGLGHIGKSEEAITLDPKEGLLMENGRDVFIHACKYMGKELQSILVREKLTIEDLDWVIPHQANIRIIQTMAKQFDIPTGKILINLSQLGNTGSASTLIAFSENTHQFKKGQLIGFTVFGGGYSSGSMLVRML